MGNFKTELPRSNAAKQKWKKKRNKTEIVFNDMKRTDFLNGFSKRKQARKKKAQEEIIAKFKEEKRRIKLQKRQKMDDLWEEVIMATNVERMGSAETIDLKNHTITVSDFDILGSSAFMGANKGLYQGPDEESRPINPQPKITKN